MTAVATAEPVVTVPAESLAGLCARVRPEFAALGDLGTRLLAVLGVVERLAGARGVEALEDPALALDILTAAPEADASVVGRVLDILRLRASSGGGPGTVGVVRESVTVAAAVERYEAGPLAVLAKGTRSGYRPWVRRLAAKHGDRDPAELTTGDLRELIAYWQLKIKEQQEKRPRRRQGGQAAAGAAVNAFRHLWTYFVEKKWAHANVAADLRKPPPPEARRRPWRPEEAALVRQFARTFGRDGFLHEIIVSIPERMGLRREEIYELRLCDVDLGRRVVSVNGKGNKQRDVAIPPVLAALLERFIEDRRPQHIPRDVWMRSTAYLLRTRPTEREPEGSRPGWNRVDRIFEALREAAPELFAGWDQVLHCYHHSLGTWVEGRYGRKAARVILGHRGRKESTDYYIYVPIEQQAEILAEYEQHLLAADPTHRAAV